MAPIQRLGANLALHCAGAGLQSPSPANAGVGGMPPLDGRFAALPAEIHRVAVAPAGKIHEATANVPHQDASVGYLGDGLLELRGQTRHLIFHSSNFFLAAGVSIAAAAAQQIEQILLPLHQLRPHRSHRGESLFQPGHQRIGIIQVENLLGHNHCIIH